MRIRFSTTELTCTRDSLEMNSCTYHRLFSFLFLISRNHTSSLSSVSVYEYLQSQICSPHIRHDKDEYIDIHIYYFFHSEAPLAMITSITIITF